MRVRNGHPILPHVLIGLFLLRGGASNASGQVDHPAATGTPAHAMGQILSGRIVHALG